MKRPIVTGPGLLATYEYTHPEGGYVTEAWFDHAGRLVLVAKTNPHARLYRFDRLIPGALNTPVHLGQAAATNGIPRCAAAVCPATSVPYLDFAPCETCLETWTAK